MWQELSDSVRSTLMLYSGGGATEMNVQEIIKDKQRSFC